MRMRMKSTRGSRESQKRRAQRRCSCLLLACAFLRLEAAAAMRDSRARMTSACFVIF